MKPKTPLVVTPDGRYFVIRHKLWRMTNPDLAPDARHAAVDRLMQARRDVKAATSQVEMRNARARVDAAKRDLGERGPVWWTDGSPDYNRFSVANTPYAQWYRGLTTSSR